MELPNTFEICEPLPVIHVTLPNGERHSGKVLSSLNGIIHYRLCTDNKEYFINITAIKDLNFSTHDHKNAIRKINVPTNGYILYSTLDGKYIHSKTTREPYTNYNNTFGKVVDNQK